MSRLEDAYLIALDAQRDRETDEIHLGHLLSEMYLAKKRGDTLAAADIGFEFRSGKKVLHRTLDRYGKANATYEAIRFELDAKLAKRRAQKERAKLRLQQAGEPS